MALPRRWADRWAEGLILAVPEPDGLGKPAPDLPILAPLAQKYRNTSQKELFSTGEYAKMRRVQHFQEGISKEDLWLLE